MLNRTLINYLRDFAKNISWSVPSAETETNGYNAYRLQLEHDHPVLRVLVQG